MPPAFSFFDQSRPHMDQKKIHDTVRRIVVEHYPMYREDPAFEEWLVSRTGGDRSAVISYLHLLEDFGHLNGEGAIDGDYARVPELATVREDLERRLEQLAPATVAALRAASIQGSSFLAELIERIDGVGSEPEIRRALEPALSAGLIIEDGDDSTLGESMRRYYFNPRHAGDIVYETIPGDERSRMHEAIVQYFTERRSEAPDPGTREMIAQMIEEHNRLASRPDTDRT